MPVVTYSLCLWPGLPVLWLRGQWQGLGVAVIFAGLLNSLLVSSWIWPEWMDPGWKTAGWWFVSLWWVGAGVVNAWRLNGEVEPAPNPDANALFREAQALYLLGDWFGPEGLLLQLLESSPGDFEARLLLATVYRRRGRWTDALQTLEHLERMDAAALWTYEIATERRLLLASQDDTADADSKAADDDGGSAEDDGAAGVPLANEGKKGVSVDEPSQQRRAA